MLLKLKFKLFFAAKFYTMEDERPEPTNHPFKRKENDHISDLHGIMEPSP